MCPLTQVFSPCVCHGQHPMCGSCSDLESRRELLETTRRELGTARHKLEKPSHLFLGKTADYSPEPRYYKLKPGAASTAHSMLFQVLKVHSSHATHQQLENAQWLNECTQDNHDMPWNKGILSLLNQANHVLYIAPKRWRCSWVPPPPCPNCLHLTSFTWWMRPCLPCFLPLFRFSMYYCVHKQK